MRAVDLHAEDGVERLADMLEDVARVREIAFHDGDVGPQGERLRALGRFGAR